MQWAYSTPLIPTVHYDNRTWRLLDSVTNSEIVPELRTSLSYLYRFHVIGSTGDKHWASSDDKCQLWDAI